MHIHHHQNLLVSAPCIVIRGFAERSSANGMRELNYGAFQVNKCLVHNFWSFIRVMSYEIRYIGR